MLLISFFINLVDLQWLLSFCCFCYQKIDCVMSTKEKKKQTKGLLKRMRNNAKWNKKILLNASITMEYGDIICTQDKSTSHWFSVELECRNRDTNIVRQVARGVRLIMLTHPELIVFYVVKRSINFCFSQFLFDIFDFEDKKFSNKKKPSPIPRVVLHLMLYSVCSPRRLVLFYAMVCIVDTSIHSVSNNCNQ